MPSMTQFLFSGSGFGCMLFGESCFAQCFGCRMGLISYMSLFYFLFFFCICMCDGRLPDNWNGQVLA
jgi:hypothetical protein